MYLVGAAYVVGVGLAGLVVAVVADMLIVGISLAVRRPRPRFLYAAREPWIMGMSLAIGVAFIVIRWMQGAFSSA